MPAVTRLGDNNTGHDACQPVALASCSRNVFINGKGAGRLNDTYISHSCSEHSPHVGHIASGSATVFINGRPAARVGDSVSCGGSVAAGSPDVSIGG
ncbi:PAAR domain-containing protein [uncultured Megasphaera sp.]|uniref:PAAR domain-containing protein n=1 Tax=uncultured Megasphaera sp. TaxID=165188 RepID=UPI00349FEA6B